MRSQSFIVVILMDGINLIKCYTGLPRIPHFEEQSCPLCGDPKMHQLEIVPLSLRHPIKKFAFNFLQ